MFMWKFYLLLFMWLLPFAGIRAQEWTKEDSVWLQRVLSGKESLQLNEETRRAIEAGTLIATPETKMPLRESPSQLPIIKSFEGLTAPDSRLEPHKLPPSVFRQYDMGVTDTVTEIPRNMPMSKNNVAGLKALDRLTPRKATVDDPATLRYGAKAFSAEDILRSLFRPSHRAKKRNAKQADAWKTY
jgi:hypothetical protein